MKRFILLESRFAKSAEAELGAAEALSSDKVLFEEKVYNEKRTVTQDEA